MEPSSYLTRTKIDDSQPELIQDWHKNGECPEETIPIRRTESNDLHRQSLSFHARQRQLNQTYVVQNGHEVRFLFGQETINSNS